MPGLLTDPTFWQWVVPILVTVGLTIFVVRAQAQRKQLSYKVMTATRVISTAQSSARRDSLTDLAILSDLKILFRGEEVSELNLREIWIGNDGNVAIQPHDFHEPIVLEIADTERGGKIVHLEVVATYPDDLAPEVELASSSSISLTRTLLNHGDWLKIKVLVAGPVLDEPKARGRVVGVKRLKRKAPPIGSRLVYLPSGALLVVSGWIISAEAGNAVEFVGSLLLVGGVFLCVVGVTGVWIWLKHWRAERRRDAP